MPMPGAPRAGRLGRVLAQHAHVAGVPGAVSLQDLHRGGLARPVRAEQGEHLARANVQVDSADRLHVAVALGQATNFHRCRHGSNVASVRLPRHQRPVEPAVLRSEDSRRTFGGQPRTFKDAAGAGGTVQVDARRDGEPVGTPAGTMTGSPPELRWNRDGESAGTPARPPRTGCRCARCRAARRSRGSTQPMPRSVARTRAWGLISWAAKMPLTGASRGSRLSSSR